MNRLSDLPDHLLERYLADTATPEERIEVERWAAENSRATRRLHMLAAACIAQLHPNAQTNVDTAWQRFEARRVHRTTPRLATPRTHRAAYAASILGALVIGVIGMAVFTTSRSRSATPLPARTYTTESGQRATVTLSDGARVLLGPATTLSVTTQPTDASLDIRVHGEALFTVTHRQGQPFRVHTDNAIARVLGTTFLVRRYDSDSVTRVIVTEGRVSLYGIHGTALLDPRHVLGANSLGTVNDSGQVQLTPNTAIEEYTAWTTGRLVFRDTPAREAVLELSRAYGVDIRIADSTIAEQPFNWTVTLTQRSLADVLETLGDALGVHPVRAGHLITLVSGRTGSRRPTGPRSLSPSESRYGK